MSMTGKTYQEAVDGWAKAQEFLIKEFIPMIALVSYTYGDLGEKKRKELEKESPEEWKMVMDYINEGKELFSKKRCSKCDNTINILEDKFCSECGEKL